MIRARKKEGMMPKKKIQLKGLTKYRKPGKGLQERMLFLQGAFKNIHQVGSILPSSQAVAQTMTQMMRQRPSPRRILEVGAGTGPITARIVREMRPGDHLDIYEIDPKFSAFLAGRFLREPKFQRVADQVVIHTAGIEEIDPQEQYDIIISAVPFTNLPPDAVRNFFETYRAILKPDGVLTYIEFVFGRAIFRIFSRKDEKLRLKKVDKVVRGYVDAYEIKKRIVPFNAPPARIRSLRFDE
jgi:phosphatidylserine decarboxylase